MSNEELISEARDLIDRTWGYSLALAIAGDLADALEAAESEHADALAFIYQKAYENAREKRLTENRIAKVVALHSRDGGYDPKYGVNDDGEQEIISWDERRTCAECKQVWPCPTMEALGLNEGENDEV